MKNHRFLRSSILLLAASLPVHADYFWDGTDLTGDADGGNGSWDTTATNWDTAATGGADTLWSAAQNAVFGGSAGNVSIAAGGITAANVIFETTGYSLQGGALSLGSGSISVPPGAEATVASTIAGSLTKTGSGTLNLTGSNSYTGATTIDAGTVKVGANTSGFRYYRFTVSTNFGNGSTTQDGYNQIGELHYYNGGVWTPAVAGSASPTNGASGTEQFWGNVNDNKGANVAGFTKFGVGSRPYSLTFDFGTTSAFNGYNWSTANDSTPARNPRRWVVSGSADGTNFVTLDDRSQVNQASPTATYTWSGATGTYVTNDNSANGGAANAYPLALGTTLPNASPVRIAAGATLDLNGNSQTVASLADSGAAGGTVTNSAATTPVTLILSSATSTSYSGTITDGGPSGAISLVKTGSLAQTLGGTASNTYSGTTTLGGTGKLVLAKTGGAIAIPGNINISSTAFNGNNSGIVLGGNEQIADTAILTWTTTSYGGGAQSDAYFRLNGRTETIGGLVASGGPAVIENRGLNDTTTTYGTGTLIINTAAGQTYTYNASIRNFDGGSNGGAVAITKTGPGTQILSGGMASCTGPALVNDGILRLNNSIGSTTMTVTGLGTLEGTGSVTGAITVNSGGYFSPGTGGAGTFTCNTGVTIGNEGTLALSGTTLAASTTATSGGTVSGAGTITGALNVQAGATLDVGIAGIGTINTNSSVTLAGTTVMQIDKNGATLTGDKLNNFTAITYGGTLEIQASGDTPVLGDTFQLFAPGAGGTFAGSFTEITGLPVLPAGLQWETTSLLTNGSITVVDTASTPSFNPTAGGYVGAQSITISGDAGSTIYYTLDGSEPTITSTSGLSPVTGITVAADATLTVKAFATLPGFTDSAVATAEYRTVTVPKWNVDAAGTWSTAANWDNLVIPAGSGITVDFTLPQSAARTVTLDSNRTIGGLVFGNASAFPWTLSTGNASILTLAVPSGSPAVEVQDVDTTISAPIAGTQGLTKTGPGVLLLTGAKSFVGHVQIDEGTLSIDAIAGSGTNSPLGAGSTLGIDGGTLRYTGAGSVGFPTFNRTVELGEEGGIIDTGASGFWFISGSVTGPGSLTKIGARQMIIQANNTYDGDTFVNEAEIQFRTLDAFGSTAGSTLVANNARVAAGGGLTGTINEDFVLNGTGGNNNGALQANDAGTAINYAGTIELASDSGIGGGTGFTISGPITGAGGLTKLNDQTVILSGATSNTYAGATTLGGGGKLLLAKTGGAIAIPGNLNLSSTFFNGNNAGVVLGGPEQIADTAIVTWTPTALGGGAQSPGYLRLNGFTETVGGLVSAGDADEPVIENRGLGDATGYGTGTLVLNVAGAASYSYAGQIRDMDGGTGGGAIAITKEGDGTQIISGIHTYSGPTAVNDGTLQIDSVLTSSPVTVAAGATLKGNGGTAATLTMASGSILAPGASAGTLVAGDTVLDSTFECEIDGATADRLNVTGNLDIAGAILDFTVLSAPTAESYVIASYTGDLTGVFEVIDLPEDYEVVYDATAKEIRLEQPAGFASFAETNGLTGDPTEDFDKDGLTDAVEYVLGTDPTTGNAGGPVGTLEDGNLVFTFVRDHDSMTPDVAIAVEVGTDLATWPGVYGVGADTASSDAGIEVTPGDGFDTITLTVSQAPDAAKFARLVVTVTP